MDHEASLGALNAGGLGPGRVASHEFALLTVTLPIPYSMKKAFPLVLLLGALALAGDEGDLVVLKDGKAMRGRVVFENDSRLVLRRDSRDTSMEQGTIERVRSRLRDLQTLLDDAAGFRSAGGEWDRKALELLGAQAEAAGLEGEAEVFRWRLAFLDPEDEAARTALGHKKRGQGWTIPYRGRAFAWDKRFEMAQDWGSAWELASLHYRLRTNLSLPVALDLLLDQERVYFAFQALLGRELELNDVCEPMTVHVHADSASYPEQAGEAGRYQPATDQVHVDASRGLDFGSLVHELTHQWLYDAFFRERKRDGQIPPWLDEGLAEYVRASVAHSPGVVFEPGHPGEASFRAHAQAKDPHDLTRVLAFSSGDYQASSDRELKYAQSYTLVHFLLHGEEGRHRAGFFEFLRAVHAGKGSATDLKRALGTDWRKLEKAWSAYVQARTF